MSFTSQRMDCVKRVLFSFSMIWLTTLHLPKISLFLGYGTNGRSKMPFFINALTLWRFNPAFAESQRGRMDCHLLTEDFVLRKCGSLRIAGIVTAEAAEHGYIIHRPRIILLLMGEKIRDLADYHAEAVA